MTTVGSIETFPHVTVRIHKPVSQDSCWKKPVGVPISEIRDRCIKRADPDGVVYVSQTVDLSNPRYTIKQGVKVYKNPDCDSNYVIMSTNRSEAMDPYNSCDSSSNNRYILRWSRLLGFIVGATMPPNASGSWMNPVSKLCYSQMLIVVNQSSSRWCFPAINHYSVSALLLEIRNRHIAELTDKHRYMTPGFTVFCSCCGLIGLKKCVAYRDTRYTGLHFDICVPCCLEFIEKNSLIVTGYEDLKKFCQDSKTSYKPPKRFRYVFKRIDMEDPVVLASFDEKLPTWRVWPKS